MVSCTAEEIDRGNFRKITVDKLLSSLEELDRGNLRRITVDKLSSSLEQVILDCC